MSHQLNTCRMHQLRQVTFCTTAHKGTHCHTYLNANFVFYRMIKQLSACLCRANLSRQPRLDSDSLSSYCIHMLSCRSASQGLAAAQHEDGGCIVLLSTNDGPVSLFSTHFFSFRGIYCDHDKHRGTVQPGRQQCTQTCCCAVADVHCRYDP